MLREILAGATLSGALAAAAYVIAYRYGAPAMLMGLLLGLSCHFLSESDRFTSGLVWASGPCLRFGVALLGLRLSVGDVAILGWPAVSAVCAAVVVTLFFWGDLVTSPRLRSGLGLAHRRCGGHLWCLGRDGDQCSAS